MFDSPSPMYSELLWLQIYEFAQFLHVTLKNGAILWICNHCNSFIFISNNGKFKKAPSFFSQQI